LNDVNLETGDFVCVRIGVKADARNVGGLNLFGSRFGNYPQDIVLTQRFQRHEKKDLASNARVESSQGVKGGESIANIVEPKHPVMLT
jgi:hypothetical protein